MILKEGSKITLIKDNGILKQDEDDFDYNIHFFNKINSFTLNRDMEINDKEKFDIEINSNNFVCSKVEESIIQGNYIFHGHFVMKGEEIIELFFVIFMGVIFITIGLSIVFKGTIIIPNLF